MINSETLFHFALFTALLLLQIPWIYLRYGKGIANLIVKLQSTFQRYHPQPLALKWHKASPRPLGQYQLQTEENRGVDTVTKRNP
jgi:hypothetical protein